MVQRFNEALKLAGFTTGRQGQQAVFDAFRAGKHVILRAPTGWGKTFSVMAALGEGHALYSLPLRVLTERAPTEAATDDTPRPIRGCARRSREGGEMEEGAS